MKESERTSECVYLLIDATKINSQTLKETTKKEREQTFLEFF